MLRAWLSVMVAPCFILCMYERVDPTTEVGIDVRLKKLKKCKMGNHNNDVASMRRFMEEHCHILGCMIVYVSDDDECVGSQPLGADRKYLAENSCIFIVLSHIGSLGF